MLDDSDMPVDENASGGGEGAAAGDQQHQVQREPPPAGPPSTPTPADDGPSTSGSHAAAPCGGATSLDLRSLVTITLNTSPVPCHPSTRLLEEIVASIFAHSPEVAGCRIIIIADGYKVPAA